MRSALLIAAVAAPLASGIRIVQSNDDGWAEINARTLFNSLAAAGNDVVLSAPAENQSGTGMYSALRDHHHYNIDSPPQAPPMRPPKPSTQTAANTPPARPTPPPPAQTPQTPASTT